MEGKVAQGSDAKSPAERQIHPIRRKREGEHPACAASFGHSNCVQTQPQKMKTKKIAQFTIVAVALALGLPARGETMSVPSAAKPAYTFDVPSGWNPKGNIEDESVEATAPDNHAYLSAWIVKTSDEKALAKDLDATLKDSLKSLDKDVKEEAIDINGVHFTLVKGSGVDKREGTKVQFVVAIFPAGGDKAGVFYADYDTNAPANTKEVLEGIVKSIKVSKK